MQAIYAEFRLDSATMNTREFYASRQGTHQYFTNQAVSCALTYNEALWRDKTDEWKRLEFGFETTPAMPIKVKTIETVYKAGDDPNTGLLRYGKQELIVPGSTFRFVAWGDLPEIWLGQVFLIGKKRAAAQVTFCEKKEVEIDYASTASQVMPIQVQPLETMMYGAFIPVAMTARYSIIQIALNQKIKRFVINNWAVPVGTS